MWRNAISRPKRVFETLRLEAILSPGESLAMTCTEPSRGVGPAEQVKPLKKYYSSDLLRLSMTSCFHISGRAGAADD